MEHDDDRADGPQAEPGGAPLRAAVEAMLDGAWREPGFCVPNGTVYPHQWLWDSCFHALVLAELGSGDRAVAELTSVLAEQGSDGFVPHMTYWSAPELHADFWGRSGTSCITQPPMYGHALAELVRRDLPVPAELIARAGAGLANLGRRQRTPAGLVPVFHPWETGCDDSLRWDDWVPAGSGSRVDRWRATKGELVGSIVIDGGSPVDNPSFRVGSIGFTALVAFNAAELATIAPPAAAKPLRSLTAELTEAVAGRWADDRWVDDPVDPGRGQRAENDPATMAAAGVSGAARTLDAMLGLLVDPREDGFDALVDPDAYGAPYGPRGAHAAEAGYEPAVYWRGPAWPQLSYLLLVAARRAGRDDVEASLARSLVGGATRSGLAEYWHPETGEGLGARPQSWAGLAVLADSI